MDDQLVAIDRHIFDDPDVRKLSNEEKATLIDLLWGYSNEIGLFQVPMKRAAERARCSETEYRDRVRVVAGTLGWGFDTRTGVLWIPSWWKHQSHLLFPAYRLRRFIGNCLAQLPATPEVHYLIRRFGEHSEHLSTVGANIVRECAEDLLAGRHAGEVR